MQKTITLALGGVNYSVPPLNMGQLARAQVIDAREPNALFEVLKIGLERAEPKALRLDDIEVKPREIEEAVKKLLAFSGFELAQSPPHAFR